MNTRKIPVLQTGLKEWSMVCRHLEEGRQTILLRKGGIHEYGGPGRFGIEHERFVLFPAWAHQNPEQVKSEFREQARPLAEPAEIPLGAWAEIRRIHRIPDRASLDLLDAFHVWNSLYLDQRWNYRPEHPLYLLVLRVWKLARPQVIPNRWEYGGCRSWVPLQTQDQVTPGPAVPAIADPLFDEILGRLETVTRRFN